MLAVAGPLVVVGVPPAGAIATAPPPGSGHAVTFQLLERGIATVVSLGNTAVV